MLTTDPRIKISGETTFAPHRTGIAPAAERFARVSSSVESCGASEEDLVVDDRAALRPAQAVENRLASLMTDTVVPVSHLQMRGLLRSR